MSFFSTLLRLCFVILPPSAFRHSPLWLQHERCNLPETKTKQSENLMTDLGLRVRQNVENAGENMESTGEKRQVGNS